MDHTAKTILQAVSEHAKRVDDKAEQINKTICPNCGFEQDDKNYNADVDKDESDAI